MKYEFKVHSLKEHEKMPWCLLRDQVIREGSFECEAPGVAQQVQLSRWVRENFQHASLITADYGSKDPIFKILNPYHSCTWRDFKPTGEKYDIGGVEVSKFFPSSYELEIKLIK